MPVREYASEVKRLFRDYHQWNKQLIKEVVGDSPLSPADMEREYDIEAMIAEDIAYLRDSSVGSRLLLAQRDDLVVGCVYLRAISDTAAEVRRLYVRPESRGDGIGRRLMKALIDTAMSQDYDRLLLNTGPHTTAAQALYTDLGFEPTDPYESEIPEPLHDHWNFMELQLKVTST